MIYQILYTQSYIKKAQKFFNKHSHILKQYQKVLEFLEIDPHHPSLRLYALKGKLTGLHSVSINLSYRITLELIIEDKKIILVNIGCHEEVYNRF